MKHFDDNDRLVECVPNFSEGRDASVIKAIAEAIDSVEGAHVLHRDMGYDANRTVISLAARAEVIVEAAFRGVEAASKLINMEEHSGEHPRMGATDVCPFIPLRNISMEEVDELSGQLGERIANELNIPVYLYEASAKRDDRVNLSDIRRGEYESIPDKIKDEKWVPDFGRQFFNSRSGMTAVGARDFLVAFNVNLDTVDASVAGKIARRVRTSGYIKNGRRIPGRINGLKAIGWLMPSYHCAQVSMNITDIESAPIEQVFETVKEEAAALGHEVMGSELIGLIPEKVLRSAGRFYSSTTFHKASDVDIIALSANHLGLNYLSKFISEERILENLL